MCGINGIVGKNSSEEVLAVMSKQTSHRGPDASGQFVRTYVALAHNRLSVIDPQSVSDQPMVSADGKIAIVFNGEIYNYQKLRSKISEWEFKTKSDTEVLLAAYSVWGYEMFKHISGMFAFAIWDEDKETLIIARDRLGIKPLFYTLHDEHLYFSSELRALIAGTQKNKLSFEGVASMIAVGYVPGEATAIEGVHRLPPAHYATYRHGELNMTRYWSPNNPVSRKLDNATLRETLDSAITSQLVADRPVGVFLSGGFDSTTIVHHAAPALQGLHTFTSSFDLPGVDDIDKFNIDAKMAAQTAKLYGTKHTTYNIGIENIRDDLGNALLALDEPISNPTTITRYIMSKWVRQDGVVVALGGNGSDELFVGYPRYKIVWAATHFQSLPKFLKMPITALSPRFKKLGTPVGPQMHQLLAMDDSLEFQSIFKKELPMNYVIGKYLKKHYSQEHVKNRPLLDQYVLVDRETWTTNESLAHTDAMTMAHGLELRVPLFDDLTVNLMDTIYANDKCSVFGVKKLLRNAYRGVLPEYVYKGPKRGWLSPGAKWLRDPAVLSFVKSVYSDNYYSGLSDLIDWVEVSKMLDIHVEKRGYHLYPLWNLLALQIWARDNGVTF